MASIIYTGSGSSGSGSSFNFKPINSGVTTAGYTVPTGRYAKIKAKFTKNRIVTIANNANQTIYANSIMLNGSPILKESGIVLKMSASHPANNSATVTSTAILPDFVGCRSYGTNSLCSGTVSVSATIQTVTTQVSTGLGYTTVTSYVSSSVSSTDYIERTEAVEVEMWVKEGDIIAASGGDFQIIYEEYSV